MKHIFGPVLSRRLGFSLGVDLVPFKTCTLDCVYCQLGRTTHKTVERKSYLSLDEIIPELNDALKQHQKIDYITLSGSGEPTLHLDLGSIITAIKEITDIPVAVLTNGTLLHLGRVRDELMTADLIVPSLDAVTQEVFCKINRPHPHIQASQMISGLKRLRDVFTGAIWLEIMLVKGVNDFPDEIKKLKDVVSSIAFDKVQLNTTVRPAADKAIEPVSNDELASIKEWFGERCEVIAGFSENQHTIDTNIPEKIIGIIGRRPLNLSEISDSLGLPKERTTKHLVLLEQQGRIESLTYGSELYYQLKR